MSRRQPPEAPVQFDLNPRPDNLASIFEEPLTVVARIRSNRLQVSDAGSFRRNIKELLKEAQLKGRERGYSDVAIQLCILAAVAFLDASVANVQSPAFAEWRGKPLQEELYNDNLAGEKFFENLRKLLVQQDTEELGDVLEVFYLCLLLGYKGKYATSNGGELEQLCSEVGQRIQRMRQNSMEIAPSWGIPREKTPVRAGDPWVKPLLVLTAVSFVLAVVLFFGFKLSLESEVAGVNGAVSQSEGGGR